MLALGLFTSYRAVSNLLFIPGQVQSVSFSGLVPQIKFNVLVQNTSSIGLTINSFAGAVYANNTIIGNVYNFLPVYIGPNSQNVIQVCAQLQILGVVNDIINAWQYRNVQQDVEIRGFANAGIIQVPINLKFTIG